jgi:chaperone modulatory protein CbpM
METPNMIAASEFCTHHNIEISFIHSLQGSGLIEIVSTEEKIFIPTSQLQQLEKLVRLYYEMDINLEGIETITYLLRQMNNMQQEILLLKSRLKLYEDE